MKIFNESIQLKTQLLDLAEFYDWKRTSFQIQIKCCLNKNIISFKLVFVLTEKI